MEKKHGRTLRRHCIPEPSRGHMLNLFYRQKSKFWEGQLSQGRFELERRVTQSELLIMMTSRIGRGQDCRVSFQKGRLFQPGIKGEIGGSLKESMVNSFEVKQLDRCIIRILIT